MLDRATIVSTLQHACATRASCDVLVPGDGAHQLGHFADIGAGMLLVELVPQPGPASVRAAQIVCITFAHPRGSCCFMTRVLSRVEHGERGARVRVAMPDSMSGIDGRLAFRVPVLDPRFELELDVPHHGRTRVPTIDVCIGGAQIQLPDTAPPLELHQRVEVALRLRSASFTTMAEVRRRAAQRYGLFFADVVREGRVNPPTGLARIVRELERRWLERRRQMAAL